ncbi:MAG: transaldolase [Candidatus Nitrohelix vancouverensis]|uniref:Transaldolase n=1 Tax=Candidatus Nitrohelix vancouverensis TaxID=2705534 RepID=A0A7T0G3N8_9BACT|nr:MAG: transaldolase [Candidatus Nitrohelix vancouverensis]
MTLVSQKLGEAIHQIAQESITPGRPDFESNALLEKLKKTGSELWVDTGELEKAQSVWKKELTALTTNNTLANQVVQSGVMDEVIRETVARLAEVAPDLSPEAKVMEVGFVINCKIALRLVQAFKTKVSVELHPAISRDLEGTLYYARRYYKVCPEYFTVKVPLTPEGLLAVRILRKEGIPINFTLGFSARQNYISARLSNPDFVNVFLGRLNQVMVDNGIGSGELVGEKATLATQHCIQAVRKSQPEISTRLIAASIRNGEQVAYLAGVDVLTIPPKALDDFLTTAESMGDLANHFDDTIVPGVDEGEWRERVDSLWDITESFVKFVDALVARPDLDTMQGADLRAFCKEWRVNLFHDFTEADYNTIREHGKIPQLSHWSELVALDDLMTQSALQSFTQDQSALDDRIRSFLK